MKRNKLFFVGLLLLCKMGFAQTPEAIREYISLYKSSAIEDMKLSGVPAAITLAQGIHETEAGRSELVQISNNHFGIKCKSTWTGETVSHDDDAKGECFRKYTSALDSYKDHSEFLHSNTRYSFLFQLDPTDYKSWAQGLKQAGYATNPKYPQILIKLIEDYNLQDYTLIAMGRKPGEQDTYMVNAPALPSSNTAIENAVAETNTPKPTIYPEGIFKINDTRVVFAPKGTSYLAIAEQYDVSLRRLFEFNDMEPQDITQMDGLIYLQRKRKTGANETHKLALSENMHSVAQVEGIRMESLLEYNYLKEGMQPQVGETLYLQNHAPGTPKLVQASVAINNEDNTQATTSMVAMIQPKATSMAASTEDAYVLHRVQPKETLYSITKRYAVKMDDVLKWNALQSPELKVGQELRINKRSSNAID